MFSQRLPLLTSLGLVLAGCDPAPAPSDAGTRVEAGPPSDAGDSLDAPGERADAASDAGSPPGACDPFGRWPAPSSTFTLEANAEGGIYLPDIQASHPEVDWSTLDRLYIAAGTYRYVNIGNLPDRTAEDPLIITNLGGQVHIGPAPSTGFGYLWIMGGGAHWVLTGRYDPIARTGDVGFQGHRCGAYASSQDRYGILSDAELLGFPAVMSHMGLVVSDASAFEVELLEIRRSSFAGVRISAADGEAGGAQPPPVDDVRVHDLYVHDVGGEGFYFGSTRGGVPNRRFTRMQVYGNRVLRTANEAGQFQSLGEGSEVHHNVFGWGAMNWRNGFEQNQDSNAQFLLREGPVEIHHNLFFGARNSLGSIFAAPQTGDHGGTITFHDNYFADAVWLGIYFAVRASLDGLETRYVFRDNVLTGLEAPIDVGYFDAPYYSSRVPDTRVFRLGGDVISPIEISGTRWDGSWELVYMPGSHVTLADNSAGVVGPVRFVDAALPADAPNVALEMWTASAAGWAGGGPITYAPGALVMDGLRMYRCTSSTTAGGARPSEDGGAHWEDLGVPVDDVRLADGSPHRGMGLP